MATAQDDKKEPGHSGCGGWTSPSTYCKHSKHQTKGAVRGGSLIVTH
ncbi:hypothetical protein BLJAPNOD_05292 [Ensifer sp. M14]|nr:hypothetical protein BLJAPNOD_05292 [Ensifer sp. M14]